MPGEVKVFKFKVALIGDSAVGKTSLVKRYVFDQFDDKYKISLGAKAVSKTVVLRTKKAGEVVECDLQIWDILGQKRFKRLQKNFFNGTQGAFIVSDITQPESFRSTEDWTEMLFGVTGPVPLVYVINKFDLIDQQKEFRKADLEETVSQNPGMFFLTSAKTGENVEAFFHRMAQILAEAVLREPLLDYDPNAPPEPLPKHKAPRDIPPPPAPGEARLVAKPESGTCDICGKKNLLFFDDGRGECPDCDHTFWWDESKRPPPPEDGSSNEPPPPED